jgi:beta-galactosidase GanA
MAGLLPEGPEQRQPQQLRLGDYVLNVNFDRTPLVSAAQNAQTPAVISGGLVIALGADEFVFAGTGLTVTFEANTPGAPVAGILSVQEGKYVNGQWVGGRWLNGDQTNQGRHLRLGSGTFGTQRIKLYRYR